MAYRWDTFRTMVLNYASPFGDNYLLNSETSNLNVLIQRRLESFTQDTHCLFDDRIALTLAQSTDAYNMRNLSVFAKPMVQIQRVTVNGSIISQIKVSDVALLYPNWQTDSDGLPTVWWVQPPHDLLFHPVPASAYSNSYISGWYQHSAYATDATSLDIPDEYIDDAARYTALALVEPGKKITPEFIAMAQLSDKRVKEIRKESARMFTGPRPLRSDRRRTCYRL